jgi:phosphatidylserine/phosphatidylglycerophosphate/cardiolipin synthase-like enzyme
MPDWHTEQRNSTDACNRATNSFHCSSGAHRAVGTPVIIRGRRVCEKCATERREQLRQVKVRKRSFASHACAPFLAFVSLYAVAVGTPLHAQAITTRETGILSIYLSPNGGAQSAVLREIEKAQRTILVEAYSFTSRPIYEALADARSRGVDVRILVDKDARNPDFRGDGARYDIAHGVWLAVDYVDRGDAHSKIMVIDATTVLTGSFNWSRAAETTNVENLLVFHQSPTLGQFYTNEWNTRASHAVSY